MRNRNRFFCLRIPDFLRQNVNYLFETQGFKNYIPSDQISLEALQAAKSIRGMEHQPAIIIHGVMPRSGTVYIGELLRLHPDLFAYPNEIMEIPFLQLAHKVRDIQNEFFAAYSPNRKVMGKDDFLTLFGASFSAYLHTFVPEGQRLLVKVPDVRNLTDFFSAFPDENLLLLIRDGRDVVHSTVKTWPGRSFALACRRWSLAAGMVWNFNRLYAQKTQGYWLARFEDAVSDPGAFVKEACQRFGLEEEQYPFEDIANIPVKGSSSIKRNGKTTWKSIPKPKNFDPVAHWVKWSAFKRAVFKVVAGKMLLKLGYCKDLTW